MTKCEVIGFTYKEVEELGNELDICIDFDMGCVGLYDNDWENNYEEIEPKLIRHIEQKYGVKIPNEFILFSSDTDQGFDELGVVMGIMYRKEK